MGDKLQELFQIVFDTAGDEGVAKLEAVLRQLAKTGADADEKLSPLADELARIGETQAAITGLIAIKGALAQTREEIAATETEISALRIAMLDKSAGPTFAKQFDTANASLARLKATQEAQQFTLTKTQGILAKSNVDTNNLAAANAALGDRAANVAKQAQAIVPALTQTGAAAKETAAGFAEIVEKSSFLSRVVEQIKGIAAAVAGLFVLEKAKDAISDIIAEGDKAQRLRAQFDDAFGGIEAGAAALERVNEIAKQVPLSLDEVQAAALHAKQQGLDPFDSTLKSLILSNAKFGGDVGKLNSLIDLLGKASNRGSIGLKEIVELQQAGIPAAKLLGDALGKTNQEILDLAKSGQLGRNSIGLLMDALGRAGAGDASNQLGLVSTLVIKLKDQWQDFLQLISESGAYDFVKEKLADINAAIRRGLADGSLVATAKAISNAIVGVGNAAAGTVRFIVDHASAIATVIKGYVLFRTTLLTLDLAGAAAKFLGLSKAAEQAATAAETAAGESGGFGKLAARINKLPKAIQIGLAIVAVDFALSNIEELIAKTNEFYATQAKQKDIDADIAAQREQLAAKAAVIAQQLQGYANSQIQSSEKVATQSRDQSAAYIEQLQNATRYYTALRIQAAQAGDSAGVASATAKLQALGAALVEARTHYDEVNASIAKSSELVASVVNHFDELKTSGTSAAEAIGGAFNDIEIPTPKGVDDVLNIVKQVSVRSREARDAVQSELVGALAKLDEVDLRNFQNNVSDRLDQAKGKADELRVALGAALQASLLKLGLSAQQAGVAISQTGEDLIATFDDIARNATSSSQQVQLAFAAALSKASTEGEVNALEDQLTQAFNAGVISADQFGIASEAAGRKVASIKAAAIEASAGLDGMGKSGETSGQRISAALQEARDQLVVQANAIAAAINTALAAGDTTGANALRAQFKGIDAQLQALNQQIDNVGDHLSNIGKQKITGPDVSGVTRNVGQIIDTSTTATRGIAELDRKAQDAGASITGTLGPALSAMVGFLDEFGSHSTAAALHYNDLVQSLFKGAGVFDQQAVSDGTQIIRFGESVAQAAQMVRKELAEQQLAAAGAAEQYQNLTDEELKSQARLKGGFDALSGSLRQTAADARVGRSEFTLLGEADLSPLSSALDAAAEKVDQLKEKAKEATDEIANIGSEIQDQIDRANGNDEAVENRRFENQIKQLKDLAAQSGDLNSREFDDAIKKAEVLHKINLEHIREEAAARKQADNQATTTGTDTTTGGNAAGGGTGPTSGGGIKSTLDVNINGTNLQNIDLNNPAIQRQITSIVLQQIKRGAAASGNFASG